MLLFASTKIAVKCNNNVLFYLLNMMESSVCETFSVKMSRISQYYLRFYVILMWFFFPITDPQYSTEFYESCTSKCTVKRSICSCYWISLLDFKHEICPSLESNSTVKRNDELRQSSNYALITYWMNKWDEDLTSEILKLARLRGDRVLFIDCGYGERRQDLGYGQVEGAEPGCCWWPHLLRGSRLLLHHESCWRRRRTSGSRPGFGAAERGESWSICSFRGLLALWIFFASWLYSLSIFL